MDANVGSISQSNLVLYHELTDNLSRSAFFPFYRNHNVFASISQEAYVWAEVAEATRTVMSIRFKLLPYMYTLFYNAHTKGETVMRALQWEFPTQKSLAGVDNQFMLGPSILVTPVLQPQVSTVKGVLPGSPNTLWYDWYTLKSVVAKPDENITMAAPLGHIPVHIRGGSILPLQQPGNNTATSRKMPYDLLITLDKRGTATGSIYLDDGESLVQEKILYATFSFNDGAFSYKKTGTYMDTNKLASITIAGLTNAPKMVMMGGTTLPSSCHTYKDGTLTITKLDSYFSMGAWYSDWCMTLM